MASYPFGLREDPFAAGLELSLEETRQLVQNRISASGGDGAAVFPPETCAEIHRRARGVASAALKLAEHAMLRAAREGAPCVSIAHVRPEGSASPARVDGTPPLAPLEVSPLSESIEGPSASPPPEVPPLPQWMQGPSAPPSPSPGRSSMPAAQATPAPRPLPTAAQSATALPLTTVPPPTAAPPSTTTPHPGAPPNWNATRLSPPEVDTPDRLHWAASVGVLLIFAVGAVILILFLNPAAGPAVRTIARTAGVETPADLPVLDDDSALVVYRAPLPAAAPTPAPIAAATTTPAESSLAETPSIGLEVARFIVRERARTERKRLAARGLMASVLTGWDGGAPSFSVVVGPFPSTGEAERTADELLGRGLVSQARVVTLKKPASPAIGR